MKIKKIKWLMPEPSLMMMTMSTSYLNSAFLGMMMQPPKIK